jgi:hypothetical protein
MKINHIVLALLVVVTTAGVFIFFSGGPESSVPNASERQVVSHTGSDTDLPSDKSGAAAPVDVSSAMDSESYIEESLKQVIEQSLSPLETLLQELGEWIDSEDLAVERLNATLAAELSSLDLREQSRVFKVIGQIIAAHPESTEAVLIGLESFQDKGMVIRATIEHLLDEEPLAAAEWSYGLEDPNLRRLAINRTSAAWAAEDLDGVIEWAAGLENRQDLATALDGITWTWAQKDPTAVYEYATQIEDEFLRNQMFLSTAKMTSHQDPVGTTEWAASFPTGSQEREQALSYSLFQWASKDVMGAVDFALELEDPKVRDSSLLSVARSWAVQDPAAATEWIESFENESARRQAWATSARQWAEKDPAGLASWMAGRSLEEVQGHVMRQVVGTIGRDDPQQAQDWILGLASPELQRAASEALFDLQNRQ